MTELSKDQRFKNVEIAVSLLTGNGDMGKIDLLELTTAIARNDFDAVGHLVASHIRSAVAIAAISAQGQLDEAKRKDLVDGMSNAIASWQKVAGEAGFTFKTGCGPTINMEKTDG